MTLFCCPSASECDSDNGFYTFDFGQTGFVFRFYKWDHGMEAFAVGRLHENNTFLRDRPAKILFSQPLS